MISTTFHFKELNEDNLNEIMELQDRVLGLLENKDLCSFITSDEWLYYLGDQGIAIGAFVDEKLIGFYAVYFPLENEDNLANDVGLHNEEKLKVIHLEAANILPEYRGHNLQKTMVDMALEKAIETKLYRYLCATVSPLNYPSIAHLFHVNCLFIDLKYKYDNRLRYICYQDLLNPIELDMGSVIQVVNTDFDRQMRLFADGYYGFKQEKQGEKVLISFAKRKE